MKRIRIGKSKTPSTVDDTHDPPPTIRVKAAILIRERGSDVVRRLATNKSAEIMDPLQRDMQKGRADRLDDLLDLQSCRVDLWLGRFDLFSTLSSLCGSNECFL
jgi:hypothetical protein